VFYPFRGCKSRGISNFKFQFANFISVFFRIPVYSASTRSAIRRQLPVKYPLFAKQLFFPLKTNKPAKWWKPGQ